MFYNINMDKINETIANSIKTARKMSCFSQTELGKRIDVSHTAISSWENGKNLPSIRDCWKLADELGMTIDELVGRDI